MEHDLQALVAFFVLPVFAFANAGISFSGLGAAQVFHPVPMGIALGRSLRRCGTLWHWFYHESVYQFSGFRGHRYQTDF
ncbi:MAG: Na+/H+ antiporter NhaA [Porticoccus sp.]|jgi:Na+/H+ antiporter NhaA|uniref:Na+/H+ antiporter NhaA n=1 Tax=Porticoccus sp. TaxID=2024853 RepID=UPI003299EEC8